MADLRNAEYTLYSSPFSLYSMMARHTVQLGPLTDHTTPPRNIDLSFINHGKNDNLKEEYLGINPKGQIPSLVGNALKEPLTDSISISLYLAEKHYPALLPTAQAAIIKQLLERIHQVNGPSINNKKASPEMQKYNPSPAAEMLKRTDISPEYRKALEFKLRFHDKTNAVAFQPEKVAQSLADLRAILAEITDHGKQSGAFGDKVEWIFGAQVGPTVLDSHLLPLLLRMLEVGNAHVVPPELQRWAKDRSNSPSWQMVMHGRPTRYDPSMGPLEDMTDMLTL
ncbi:hypothetical protein BGZ61DRAFT_527594 [Ilyonectria robusta]|uniref:uncharacterized protein n=1 Tax=Ilyonectria robusta TaxID=1079257 RepID=UPI001E8ED857|nr:uncharacterized protein BGZ61DRAFT_527594 [Ilyonectria robusta]KAH8734231.1 hypothetical protein BGZ61DRAFT_527594 [Ilyonectria robusta]